MDLTIARTWVFWLWICLHFLTLKFSLPGLPHYYLDNQLLSLVEVKCRSNVEPWVHSLGNLPLLAPLSLLPIHTSSIYMTFKESVSWFESRLYSHFLSTMMISIWKTCTQKCFFCLFFNWRIMPVFQTSFWSFGINGFVWIVDSK